MNDFKVVTVFYNFYSAVDGLPVRGKIDARVQSDEDADKLVERLNLIYGEGSHWRQKKE